MTAKIDKPVEVPGPLLDFLANMDPHPTVRILQEARAKKLTLMETRRRLTIHFNEEVGKQRLVEFVTDDLLNIAEEIWVKGCLSIYPIR